MTHRVLQRYGPQLRTQRRVVNLGEQPSGRLKDVMQGLPAEDGISDPEGTLMLAGPPPLNRGRALRGKEDTRRAATATWLRFKQNGPHDVVGQWVLLLRSYRPRDNDGFPRPIGLLQLRPKVLVLQVAFH